MGIVQHLLSLQKVAKFPRPAQMTISSKLFLLLIIRAKFLRFVLLNICLTVLLIYATSSIFYNKIMIIRKYKILTDYYTSTVFKSRKHRSMGIDYDDQMLNNVVFHKFDQLCPLYPEDLMGQLPVPMLLSVGDVDYALILDGLEKKHADVNLGGHWSPKDCRPRRRLAVIVPYRKRAKHLVVLLNELHDILKRQLSEYRIFVAEQYKNLTYNKALLMNYAFTVVSQTYPAFDCFIFHDVDLIPEDDTNLYECGHNPKHMSPSVDTLHYRLPYKELLGGVFAIRAEVFKQINGYSNLYWGWGGEDDDIYIRVVSEGYQVERPPAQKGRYRMVSHLKRSTIERQILRKLYNTSAVRYKEDGLNQLPFMNITLVGVRPKALYTHLMIDVGPPVDMEDVFDALFAFG